jgi:hypothetical protein
MRPHFAFTPLLAALALACAGETTDSGLPPSGGPQLRTGSSSDGPGAFVIRSTTTNAFLFSTPESNVTVISGLSLDQAGSGVLRRGGAGPFPSRLTGRRGAG